MPDTSSQGTLAAIIVILAIIAFVVLRGWLVRYLTRLLVNAAGRTVLGVLLCLGGLVFGFTSSDVQNNWPVGVAIAGTGLLLLLITFGIPFLSKRWEREAAERTHPQSYPPK